MKSSVKPYIERDGDTPCSIGHVCPYDTSCNLLESGGGIDQIKQNRIFSFTSRGSNFETHECIFSMIISPHEKIKRA